MYRHALLLTFGLAALIGAGCTSTFTKGTPIMEYQKGKAPPLQEAPSDGEYVLMSSMMNTTPKATLRLHEGDALGFKPGQTGQVVAVGGTKEIVLPDGNYIWKRRSIGSGSSSSESKATTQP
jgi:hypothetical protein